MSSPFVRRKMSLLACCTLMLCVSAARAGWYEVRNYVGTVGTVPVHVSLQTFDTINHGQAGQRRVEGSYYYDTRRIPIPLQGQRAQDGSMVLCEAEPPRSMAESPMVHKASAARPVPCPINLKFAHGDDATGVWNDGKKTLSIALRQIGSLDDTQAIRLTGVVEIPMWYHTKTHMLLGVYQSAEDCPVSMLHLRLVNIATGRIRKDIPFDCSAGMIMTSIYANVSRGLTARQVTVGFQGGKMGHDEEIDIE